MILLLAEYVADSAAGTTKSADPSVPSSTAYPYYRPKTHSDNSGRQRCSISCTTWASWVSSASSLSSCTLAEFFMRRRRRQTFGYREQSHRLFHCSSEIGSGSDSPENGGDRIGCPLCTRNAPCEAEADDTSRLFEQSSKGTFESVQAR